MVLVGRPRLKGRVREQFGIVQREPGGQRSKRQMTEVRRGSIVPPGMLRVLVISYIHGEEVLWVEGEERNKAGDSSMRSLMRHQKSGELACR